MAAFASSSKWASSSLGLMLILLLFALFSIGHAPVAQAASGELDPSFGSGGTVTTEFPAAVNSQINASAIQADGKVVVTGQVDAPSGGTNFALARYNVNGSLDTTFGSGGRITTGFLNDSYAYDVTIQADGKIIAAGEISPFGGYRSVAITRYLADGRLDPAFGTGGKVTTSLGGDSGGRSVTIQADGKIVIAGFSEVSTQTGQDFALARYLSNGSLDTNFGVGGMLTTDFGNTSDGAFSVTLQVDGKIVAAGAAGTNFALARYLPNGDLDTGFGSAGKVTTDFGGGFDYATGLAVTPDGRIVLAGYAGSYEVSVFALARYTPDGNLDPSFGTGGIVTTDFGTYTSRANALSLQADGKLLVGGYTAGNCNIGSCFSEFALARYLTSGDLDPSFGTGGRVRTSFGPVTFAGARAISVQADGKLIAAGYGPTDQRPLYPNFALVRYLYDGSVDSAYGSGGKASAIFNTSNAGAYALALQADGKLVAVGPAAASCGASCRPGVFALTRYLSDGSLDGSFGTGGKVTTLFTEGEAQAYGVAIQSDGKIVVAGYAGYGTDGAFALARYMPNGALDTSFGNGGKVTTNVNSDFEDAAFGVAIQPDGMIVAAGYSSNGADIAIVRYLPNGSLDPSFGYNGIVRTRLGNRGAFALALAIQPDGKIIAGGMDERLCSTTCTNENFVLVRYLPNGQLDTSFGSGGIVVTSLGNGGDARVHSIVLEADGKIVAAGLAGIDCSYGCRTTDFGLARYLPNGSLDATFGIGGIVTTDFTGGWDIAYGFARQPDGKFVAVGLTTGTDYSRSFGVVRYLNNGSLDPGFGNSGRVTTALGSNGAEANAVVIDSQGRIVTAGQTWFDDGSSRFALARYLTSGPPPPTSTPTRTATPPPVVCTPGVFSDVPPGSTFYPFVTCLANSGVISGYADCTFRPNLPVTRGQLAKIVSNAASYNDPVSGQTFEDVPPSNPFYVWIERLTTRGYMTGYVCGSPGEPCVTGKPYFRWGQNATRGQTAKIVSNAAGFTEPPVGQTFEDVPSSDTFYPFIQRLASRNVMGGYPCGGTGEPCISGKPYFRPNNDVTRGQSAKIVANTFFPDCVTSVRP